MIDERHKRLLSEKILKKVTVDQIPMSLIRVVNDTQCLVTNSLEKYTVCNQFSGTYSRVGIPLETPLFLNEKYQGKRQGVIFRCSLDLPAYNKDAPKVIEIPLYEFPERIDDGWVVLGVLLASYLVDQTDSTETLEENIKLTRQEKYALSDIEFGRFS